MVGCGIVTCLLFRINDTFACIIICGMFATFPMLFEIFSYPSIRFFVPLAALLAMFGVLVSGNILGAIFVFLALNIYQSSVYLFIIMTVYASAVRFNNGGGVVAVARSFILPRIARVLAGGIAYAALYFFLARIVNLGGMGGERLSSFVMYSSDIKEAISTAVLIFTATLQLFTSDWLFFPAVSKYIFLFITIILLGTLAIRRNMIGLCLVLIAPLFIFGAAWIMYPANKMLQERILFSFVGVYAGTFAVAWVSVQKYRGILSILGIFLVIIFAYQANVWHLYMDLRNRADLDLTRSIADEIKSSPDFKPGLPLVVVGVLQDRNYLPYRVFNLQRGKIGNTMLASMYTAPWSADRALMFFVDFRRPSPAETSAATTAAQNMPIWPATGSVGIQDNTIVIRLK